MLYPIAIVIEADDDEMADASARDINEFLLDWFGEDTYGIALYGGSEVVPMMVFLNGDDDEVPDLKGGGGQLTVNEVIEMMGAGQ